MKTKRYLSGFLALGSGVAALLCTGAPTASAAASDWKTSGSSEWNTAKVTTSDTGTDQINLVGTGDGSSEAKIEVGKYEPLHWYELTFEVQNILKHRGWPIGSPYVATPFANLELWDFQKEFRAYRFRVQAPQTLSEDASFLAVGQKNHTGEAALRNLQIRPVIAAPLQISDAFALRRNEGVFDEFFYANEDENSLGRRTGFSGSDTLDLIYQLGNRPLGSSTLSVNGCNLSVSASVDEGKSFFELGKVANNGATFAFDPAEHGVVGAKQIQIRIGNDDPAKKGVLNFTRFQSHCDSLAVGEYHLSGLTFFYTAPLAQAERLEWKEVVYDPEQQNYTFRVTAVNDSARNVDFQLSLYDNDTLRSELTSVTVAPGSRKELEFRCDLPETGERALAFFDRSGNLLLRADVDIPVLKDLSQGLTLTLPGGELADATVEDAELSIWGAPANYHVERYRKIPKAVTQYFTLAAARNEAESLQIVLHGNTDFNELNFELSDFLNAQNSKLLAGSLELHKVDYLFVTHPTDPSSVMGYWTDPVESITGDLSLARNENLPLLLTVRVPSGTAAGIYQGSVAVKRGETLLKTIPVRIQVYDFTLPESLSAVATCDLGTRYIEEAHRATSDAEKRSAFEEYLKLLASCHVSPYNPTPYDQPEITWPADGKGAVKIDFTRYEKELKRVIDTYHFNRITVSLPLPSGVKNMSEANAEQEALFADAIRQYQEFYERNGLLDTMYVYVWDEPSVNAFAPVKKVLTMLRSYAPKLHTMLTPFWIEEHWRPQLDIWAFLLHHYIDWGADASREKGEELWWYLCTNPRAPYPTGFIDHGAAEMRSWLWLSRQYQMTGTLFWSSVYWCDPNKSGYPARNMYQQPMLFNESGNEFGNGDGMLLYPPSSAFAANTPAGFLKDKPALSLRMIAWRDGLEDYEYFAMLERQMNSKRLQLSITDYNVALNLLQVPESVARTIYDFASMPDAMLLHRQKLAQALEYLEKK